MMAVGTAKHGVDAPLIRRTLGVVFPDEGLQDSFVDDREEHLADHPVRLLHGGLGKAEQDQVLAMDLLKAVDDLRYHPALRVGRNAVDDLNQQLDQAIDDGPAPLPSKGGKQRVANGAGMATQLVDRFGGYPQAVTFQNLWRHPAEQGVRQLHVAYALELGDLFAQTGEACTTRVGLEAAEGNVVRRPLALGFRTLNRGRNQQGIKTLSGRTWELAVYGGKEGCLETANRRTDDPVDAITARRFDPVLAAPIQYGRPQMARVLILRHDLLAEPEPDGLHVIDGGLPEAEEGAKLLAVATAAAASKRVVEPDGRQHLKLFAYVTHSRHRHFFVIVREPAFDLEKLQQQGKPQSALLCALIRKLLLVAAQAPQLSEFTAAPALFHPSLPPKRGSESSWMNYSEGEFGTSEQLCCNWAYVLATGCQWRALSSRLSAVSVGECSRKWTSPSRPRIQGLPIVLDISGC